MQSSPVRRALQLAATVSLLLPAGPALAAPRDTREVALDWYDQTRAAVSTAALPEQLSQTRTWAVSWIAAARAVGENGNARFQTAAFASALHDTLVALVPSRQSQLDAALADTLADVPDGPQKQRGIGAGQASASEVLADRAGDGTDAASIDPPWSPPAAAPGVWQPTPPTFGPAVRAGQRYARPFVLGRADRLRPGPPPALDSQTYLDALAEVRAVGRDTSTTRTAAQTDVARFWIQNPIDAYVQVLRQLIAGGDDSLLRDARLVAGFHAITGDAQIAIYDAKYTYVAWRPVTAIRTGSVDPDPSWTPLLATPRHPEYPSGHTGFAGSAEAALTALAGPRPPRAVDITSTTEPGVTHTFTSWRQITQENIDGRVWEGVHFRFSDEAGAALGRRVGEYDLAHLRTIGL